MDNSVISKVEYEFRSKRTNARLKFKQQMKKMLADFPELDNLYQQRRDAVCDFSCSKEQRKANIAAVDSKIHDFINKNGITVPIMEYECPVCKDSGMENDKRCACFLKRVIELSTTDNYSNIDENFDTFDLNVFDESVKPTIEKIKNYAISYCDAFPQVKRENIIFTGHTGTGKTFLLNCICSRLRARGYSVVFASAGRIFEILRKYAFGEIGNIDSLLQADLLIIDDLGSEPLFNNITVEYLFMLINERTASSKAICVSTNLSSGGIAKRYTDRIASRLFNASSSYVFNLEGEDLRRKK